MPYYNLATEYASLIIVVLAMISFTIDEKKGGSRYSALRWMQLATLISIVVTIGSLITADFFMDYPLWLTDILKYLYFLTSPIAAPLALFYGITLIYPKTYKVDFAKKYLWAWLPYALYCVFVVTNAYHRLIFTISPTEGYIRGELFRITYVIALYYAILVFYFTIKNRKSPQKNSLYIVGLNLFVASLIFCTQLFMPPLQLSGLASVVGVLILQFYIHNVSQSTDPLTELYNRTNLANRMTNLCKSDTPYSLFVFSIRNFKGINERNGLEFGDNLLEKIALRFKENLTNRQIFRYSGDEFAVLLVDYEKLPKQLIPNICSDISRSYEIDGGYITIDFVYAQVDFPLFGINTQEIISAMDYSLSLAKKSVSNLNYIYDSSISDKMKRRNYVIERIKKALKTDGFEMHYQPIYSVNHSEFNMAEALIRFKPNQGDFVSPGEFIPIAEETGLIIKITQTVLELVCADYQKLQIRYGENLKVRSISVNFPYVWFMKQGVAKEVYDTVKRYDLSPEMIKIELTERTFVTDIKTTLDIMNEFIKYGFIFELDDFGVEYSNFSMFFDVPIQVIKFDRSFVVSSTVNSQRRDFFNMFLKAIKSLDREIKVVMEGVETDDLKQYLIDCGCDYIQGFVFSKPLVFNEYSDFLENK